MPPVISNSDWSFGLAQMLSESLWGVKRNRQRDRSPNKLIRLFGSGLFRRHR